MKPDDYETQLRLLGTKLTPEALRQGGYKDLADELELQQMQDRGAPLSEIKARIKEMAALRAPKTPT